MPNIPAAKRAGLPVDLDRLGRDGDGWLTPEERYALKTYGVCAQVQPGVFMIRVRVPGGRLTPGQATGLAALADRYGYGWIHLTTRQNVELHWVSAYDVPSVLRGVEELGLTNRSACGHTMRNVMACPDAGVGLEEPFDCSPDARAVSDAILARSAELNCRLPSRVNISFGGCTECRGHARLNDAGFVSTVVGGEAGYQLWAGGSLGTMPFLAVPLVDFLPRREALPAAVALVDVFIAHGELDNPKKGRMKFAVEAMGEQAFRDAFFRAFGARRDQTAPPAVDGVLAPAEVRRILGHVPHGGWANGVRPQRTPGLAMATVNVPLGDLVGDDLRAVSDVAVMGDGHLYLTRNQNVMFRGVPLAALPALRARLAARNLALAGADESVDVRACTGSAVCALGITAAPDTGSRLIDRPAVTRNSSLRIHVSGCPNSCAQHQAADIGLSGAKVRIGGATRFGYHVWVGADLGSGALAAQVGRVAEEDVIDVVEAIVGLWEALRHPGERLAATVARVGIEGFAAQVAACADRFQPEADTVVDLEAIPETVTVS